HLWDGRPPRSEVASTSPHTVCRPGAVMSRKADFDTGRPQLDMENAPRRQPGPLSVRILFAPMIRSLSCLLGAAATLALATVVEFVHAASLDPATWKGDARFLVAAVDSIHPEPYRWYRRAAWDSAAADLERRLPTLRYDQAVAGFSSMLGMLRDGHSRLGQFQLVAHGRPTLAPLPGPGLDTTYPIDCEIFADGLWIQGVRAERADLLGCHVIAIGGRPVRDAVTALSPFIPADNPMWTLRMLPVCLRSPGYLAAAGLTGSPSAPL